jgi:restriction endonuclease S subunit
MLRIHTLGALPVPVPPLETQRKIVALQRLWEQEKQLTERLLHNRETMLAGIFQHLLEH